MRLGMIINGQYLRSTALELIAARDALKASEDHDSQRQDHQTDLIQPYNQDGSINQDFIINYPLESKEVYGFTQTENG